MNSSQNDMSFLDHLEVFRWHLIRSIIAILIFALGAFIFKQFIFDVILLGPKNPDFITYTILCKLSNFLSLDDSLCLKESPFNLMNITMSGQFSTHIKVSMLSGFILAFPYIIWEFWCFVRPALYNSEATKVKLIVFISSLLFFTGILFGYYVIAPMSVNFLGSYQVSANVANQISLTSFISTVCTVCLANGIIFELPVIVYFLARSGLITPDLMRTYRKHAIVGTLILSAIITPPDITSQILVSLPIIILYEFSITICRRVLINKQNINS